MLPIFDTLVKGTKVVAFQAKRYAPQIMAVSGVALGAGTVVLACVATVKANNIVGEAHSELDAIEDTKNNSDTYTEEEYRNDRKKVYVDMAVGLVKAYAWAAASGVASTALILAAIGILQERYTRTAIGAAGALGTLREYRKAVVDTYGEEADKKLRYGLKEVEVKEKIVDENGKTKTVKKKLAVLDKEQKGNPEMDYCRMFDWSNPMWDSDMRFNWLFLNSQQSYFNDLLRANGHVFLNDVLKALGYPVTRVGQEVGWNYNPDDDTDGYIDFRATEVSIPVDRTTSNGDTITEYKNVIMLDFNVDGSIINKVDWADQRAR